MMIGMYDRPLRSRCVRASWYWRFASTRAASIIATARSASGTFLRFHSQRVGSNQVSRLT